MENPKVSIITPTFNSEKYLEETIISVLNQSYSNFEFIIIDGSSTDNSKEIIDKYKSDLAYYVSEPDDGMYDAIAKGLAKATGDIHCYLNSDDLMHPAALQEVVSIFQENPCVNWINGRITSLLPSGLVSSSTLPFPWSRRMLKSGFYNINGNSVPQESTFWRSKLTNELQLGELRSFRLAGDAYIWSSFAKKNKLYIVNAQLAGFRRHGDNLSAEIGNYQDEAIKRLGSRRSRLWKVIKLLSRMCPDSIKLRLFAGYYIHYSSSTNVWQTSRREETV